MQVCLKKNIKVCGLTAGSTGSWKLCNWECNTQKLKYPKKLKKFDSTQIINLRSYIPPRTEIESRLAKIWSELLSMSPVGIQDDFFNLGGHSLIVTNLSIKLMDEFNYTLSLQQFF